MRVISLFLSSIVVFLAFVANAGNVPADSIVPASSRYAFEIETSKAALSGFLITKESTASIAGSMINEFGISAIDFIYEREKNKLELKNVVGFLNKWYIRKVLKNDLLFCLHILYDIPYTKRHHYIVERSESSVTIINNKRHLKYSFSLQNPAAETYETER